MGLRDRFADGASLVQDDFGDLDHVFPTKTLFLDRCVVSMLGHAACDCSLDAHAAFVKQ